MGLARAPVTPWGEPAFVLVGALSHSGRFRAVFCEQMTFGHLAGAMHEVLVGLGGTAGVADRSDGDDRDPGHRPADEGRPQIAKHYAVQVAVCPPRRAQRKGVVEAAIKSSAKRWWRTAPGTIGEAQQRWTRSRRTCPTAGPARETVGELGASEPLRALPAMAFPAADHGPAARVTLRAGRFEANEYSVPPVHAGRGW